MEKRKYLSYREEGGRPSNKGVGIGENFECNNGKVIKLKQTTFTQVVLNDDIIHSRHNKSNLLGICCTSEMSVNLFGIRLIQGHEAIEDVVTRGIVSLWTFKVGETLAKRVFGQFLLEDIDLV